MANGTEACAIPRCTPPHSAELDARSAGVAGALRSQGALDDDDLPDFELETRDVERAQSGRDRPRLRPARILLDPRQRQMGRERAVLEVQPGRPKLVVEALAQ